MKFFTLYSLFISILLLSLCNSGTVNAADELDEEISEDVSVVEDRPSEVVVEEEVVPEDTRNSYITVLFTKPSHLNPVNLELPAGKRVELLVGFTNKGAIDYVVEKIDASFRYPMDYSFYIQNFTTVAYEQQVPSGWDATFYYVFVPADSFASRPFGLSIGMTYRDEYGSQFYEKVYNETVVIVEVEEGLDGETFFLYVFLCAGIILLLVIGQQFLYSVGKKHVVGGSSKKPTASIETGTKKLNSIDYDFIPKHMLNHINKGTKTAKTQPSVPKQRKTKRNVGADR